MDELTQAYVPLSRIDLAREADFALGPMRVRPSRREVESGGTRRLLQRRVMQVLVALAQSSSDVVSQRELIVRCWNGLSVSDDAVGRCIAQLRRLAASWPEPPFEIVTFAGVGYRLEAAAVAPNILSFRPPAGRLDRDRRRVRELVAGRPRLALGMVGGLVAIALATLAAFGWIGRAPTLVTPVIAVRPLTAIGADPGLPSLAARASDAIAGFLGDSAVRVVSGPNAKAPLALGGALASASGQLHLQLYLEDTPSRATIWSREFVEPVQRADALIDEAKGGAMETTNIVRAFYGPSGPQLDPETALLTIRGTENLFTTDDSVDSLRDFEQALSRRPDLPGLHTAYAIALVQASATAPAAERAQMLSRARAAVEKVIREHRDFDGNAACTLWVIESNEAPLDWVTEERELDKLLRAAPDNPIINANKCKLLVDVGRASDSLYYCRRALSLRPHTAGYLTYYAIALDDLKGNGAVLPSPDAVLDEGARLYPNDLTLRWYRFSRDVFGGPTERAVLLLHDRNTPPPVPADFIQPLELLEKARKSGTRADANTALAALRTADARLPKDEYRFLFPMALGRLDEAFAAPDISVTGPNDRLVFRFTEPLRNDPRYWPLAAKAGLVRYWLTTNKWPYFCSDPTYPLDCRAEARRFAAMPRS